MSSESEFAVSNGYHQNNFSSVSEWSQVSSSSFAPRVKERLLYVFLLQKNCFHNATFTLCKVVEINKTQRRTRLLPKACGAGSAELSTEFDLRAYARSMRAYAI